MHFPRKPHKRKKHRPEMNFGHDADCSWWSGLACDKKCVVDEYLAPSDLPDGIELDGNEEPKMPLALPPIGGTVIHVPPHEGYSSEYEDYDGEGGGWASSPSTPSSSSSSTYTYASAKWVSAGGVVLRDLTAEGLGYIYIVKPSNNYGDWTFPKGRVDKDDSLMQTALREVMEETGVTARLLPNGYLGSGDGISSTTHYYMMVRSGGNPWAHDFETEQVRCISFAEAAKLLGDKFSKRDAEILTKAAIYVGALRVRLGYN